MKILFVDDDRKEYERFLALPFPAELPQEDIVYRDSPVRLSKAISGEQDLRLVVLDLLWGEGDAGVELGVDAMREIMDEFPEVPVIIYSVMDDESRLRELVPEMMRLGAYDWVSKDDSYMVRSFRFERAYREGRASKRIPGSHTILGKEQDARHDVAVAVMFADMCGFTAITNEIGASNMVEILGQFYAWASKLIIDKGGYVDKYIGDEVMAVFGAAGSDKRKLQDFGADCVDAALALQVQAQVFKRDVVDPRLKERLVRIKDDERARYGKLRIGIESGEVEIVRFARGNESETTFIGTPVNIASRILGIAEPGQILVGENMKANNAVRPSQIQGQKKVEYKHLPGKFQAYEIKK